MVCVTVPNVLNVLPCTQPTASSHAPTPLVFFSSSPLAFFVFVFPVRQAQPLSVNAGTTWPAVMACTKCVARSLPSLGGEGEGGEAGPDGVAAALRQVVTADPSHYPEYEPTLMAAQKRLNQRRRAEDAIGDTQARRVGGEGAPRREGGLSGPLR